jgi:hypothetical protein
LPRASLAWIAVSVSAAASAAAQEIPLQIVDATPRAILVRFEQSIDPASVGQTFGPAWPAAWSVSAGVGRVELSAETHGLARSAGEGLGFAPVPGSFAPIAIEIDLATLEATSEPTGGALTSGPLSLGFATRALASAATAGFIAPDAGEFFCTSQQQIDDLCPIIPFLCGKTCTVVPGEPFDPVTGMLNLVGSESQQGCDGGLCSGPFERFARTGDLLLVELSAPGVPAASRPLRAGLVLLLATLGALALRKRRSERKRIAQRAESERSSSG